MSTNYHFASSLRRGLASTISGPATEARAHANVRAVIERERLDGSKSIEELPAQPIALMGPGDLLGFDPAVISRRQPNPEVKTFAPHQFPFVEFSEPDFPWRFTPDAADSKGRLQPWLSLIVLIRAGHQHAEYRDCEARAGLPPAIEVHDPSASLPDLTHAWRWVHVQGTAGPLSKPAVWLPQQVEAGAATVLARAMCPRRLRSNTPYLACVVPTFELGRRAGLGLSLEGIPGTARAWDLATAPSKLVIPCYARWEFSTGEHGSFEELVRRLQARADIEAYGSREMSCARPGTGLPRVTVPGVPTYQAHVLGLEGALRPVGSQPTAWGRDSSDASVDPFRSALAGLLVQSGVPISAAQVQLSKPAADAQFGPIQLSAIGPTSIRARWTTSVPRTSIVSVQRPGREVQLTSPDEQTRTVHDVTVRGLEPGQTYTLRLLGRGPDQAQSAAGKIVTPALPKVTPPIYGRWHGSTTTVAESSRWLDAINLDPRHRVAAGVGAEIVRRDQELLMASAWEQLGPVERANAIFRHAQLGRDSSVALWRRLDALDPDTRLGVLAPVLHRVALTLSGRRAAAATHLRDATVLPSGALLGAFRRLRRRGGPLDRRRRLGAVLVSLAEGKLEVRAKSISPPGVHMIRRISEMVEQDVVTSPAPPPPSSTTSQPLRSRLDTVRAERVVREPVSSGSRTTLVPSRVVHTSASAAIGAAASSAIHFYDEHITLEALASATFDPQKDGVPPELVDDAKQAVNQGLASWLLALRSPTKVATIGAAALCVSAVEQALRPSMTVTSRALARLRTIPDRAGYRDPLDPVVWAPSFPRPMFEALRELSHDWILPGIAKLPQNTVALFEVNRRFVESFMLGLNHELTSELLWRGYPTDQRGTYFRHFWDRRPTETADIDAIDTWGARALGHNGPNVDANLAVLLIRGELLHKFPGTVIYAAVADGDRPALPEFGGSAATDGMIAPIFRADLSPDITLIGFPFSGNSAKDYFFVFEERAGETRFGLDISIADGSDLAWPHFRPPGAEDHDWHLDGRAPVRPHGATEPDPWWQAATTPTSAKIAGATLLRPVRVAYQGSALLRGL